jgi:hypothetical protein
VRPDTVNADAKDLRVELIELFLVVDHASVLFGADRAPIQGVEDKNDPLLAAKVTKLYFFLILILQREFGRGRADG